MKLSEAIRIGAMLKPQARGELNTGKATCALGAAFEADPPTLTPRLVTGPLDLRGGISFRDGDYVEQGTIVYTARNPEAWNIVTYRALPCPACSRIDDGYRLIPHLNDSHHWTREQIADWVATLEPADPHVLDGVGLVAVEQS